MRRNRETPRRYFCVFLFFDNAEASVVVMMVKMIIMIMTLSKERRMGVGKDMNCAVETVIHWAGADTRT